MSKWSARDGILARHAGHHLTGIDARSVRCEDCSHTLLLDANRDVLDTGPTAPAAPGQATPEPRADQDAYGRRPCPRCGKRVSHVQADGVLEPVPHAVAGSTTGQPCRSLIDTPSHGLPIGGWRALAQTIRGGTA